VAPEGRTDAYGDRLPDGARYRLGTPRFWDPQGFWAFAWAPDGKALAAGGDGVRLWQFPGGREARHLEKHLKWIECLAFSPDGKALAAGGKGGAWLWDLTGRTPGRRLAEPDAVVHAVAFAPDGRTLALSGKGRTVRLLDAATGKEVRTLTMTATAVPALGFSPDGKALAAVAQDGSWDDASANVVCFETASGKRSHVLPVVPGFTARIAFSPDGKVLAARDGDRAV
jgi:WD40 repeat protein